MIAYRPTPLWGAFIVIAIAAPCAYGLALLVPAELEPRVEVAIAGPLGYLLLYDAVRWLKAHLVLGWKS